jgi:membrane carboxypeptidase/penicillin-binding protein PbpC
VQHCPRVERRFFNCREEELDCLDRSLVVVLPNAPLRCRQKIYKPRLDIGWDLAFQ